MARESKQVVDIYSDHTSSLRGTDQFLELESVSSLFQRTLTPADREHLVHPFRLDVRLYYVYKEHPWWGPSQGVSGFSFITQDPLLVSGMWMNIYPIWTQGVNEILNLLKKDTHKRVFEYDRFSLNASWTFFHEWQHLLNKLRSTDISLPKRNSVCRECSHPDHIDLRQRYKDQEQACDVTAFGELTRAYQGANNLPILLNPPQQRLIQTRMFE